MLDADLAAILADPAWFPHRYDAKRDEVHFVWLPREAHRETGFLTDESIAKSAQRKIIPRAKISGAEMEQGPLHLILHSGLAGSTLLTRALDVPGTSMALSEPPILTDVMGWKISNAAAGGTRTVVADIMALLARPFSPGEATIVKVGAVANGLGSDILEWRDSSRALCLQASLPIYLALQARKGLFGRIWGRQLYATLESARLTEFGFDKKELWLQTDLQIAALAWLAIHRELRNTATRFAERVGFLDSEKLLDEAQASLAALARQFELQIDVEKLTSGPVFQRHSKTGESFDAAQRQKELGEAKSAHGEEIDMIVQWIEKVAEARSIPLELSDG